MALACYGKDDQGYNYATKTDQVDISSHVCSCKGYGRILTTLCASHLKKSITFNNFEVVQRNPIIKGHKNEFQWMPHPSMDRGLREYICWCFLGSRDGLTVLYVNQNDTNHGHL